MRPLLKELVPWKESLTMENVFAPQAQQLQTAISPELSIAAEVCRALSNVLRYSPSFKTIPSSMGSEFAFAALGRTDRERERETN